jgi:CheY-like chemotaxis protein
MSDSWRVVYVEDQPGFRVQVKEYLEGSRFSHGPLSVFPVGSFTEAHALLADRKVDLLILDVFATPMSDHDPAGLGVLSEWRKGGFAPVVLYTALPHEVEHAKGPFVTVVGKDAGLDALLAAITNFFEARIPQTHRAIADHVGTAVGTYMWDFVSTNWHQIKDLTTQPEFLRLLLARLGSELGNNLRPILERVYGGEHADPAPETVHPAAYYVKPPIGHDVLLGDLRIVEGEIVLVLWPSCDMVLRGQVSKVDDVLCAGTVKVVDTPEFSAWKSADNKKTSEALERMFRNQRQGAGLQSERYHFLPKVWDIPALLIDFANLRQAKMATLRSAVCIATVASPFAESISTRFVRYIARVGTPDLDTQLLLTSFR